MGKVTTLLLVVVLAVAAALVVKLTGVASGGPGALSAADAKRLEALQNDFRAERGKYLHLREIGAPAAEQKAQE
jgi:hypothetical protein